MRRLFIEKYGGIGGKIFAIFIITLLFVSSAFVFVIRAQGAALRRVVREAGILQKEAIAETSKNTMDEVFSSTLKERTDREAKIAGFMLAELRSKVITVRNHMKNVLARPLFYNTVTLGPPNASNDGTYSSMYIMGPDVSPDSLQVQARMRASRNITHVMEEVLRQGTGSTFFIGFPENFMVITTKTPSEMIYGEDVYMTLDVKSRVWYREALEHEGIFFSSVERDSITGMTEIVCATAVYEDNGDLFCVIGANLRVSDMAEFMQASASEYSYEIILNSEGQLVYAPDNQDLFTPSLLFSIYDTKEDSPEFLDFVRTSFEQNVDTTVLQIDGNSYYVDSAKIGYADWIVISIADAALAREPANNMIEQFESITSEASTGYNLYFSKASRIILLVLVLFLILGSSAAIWQARRITMPLKKMARELTHIGDEGFHFELQKMYKTGDEIEVLATAFSNLEEELDRYITEETKNASEKERLATELKVATQIQADMLPSIFPAYPDQLEFDLYASMTPAREVGGDFYDFFFVDEHHLALVMADVSGKGVPAALFMVIARTLLKNRTKMGGSPADILSYVNHQLCKGNKEAMFVTIWLAIIDIRTGEGWAANAGHEHPALCDRDGRFRLVTYKHSMVMGMMDNISFSEHKFKLEPGDTLFVYTDGIPEATDSENMQLGTNRMLEILNRNPSADPETIINSMSKGINSFINGAEQFDDITMLCFKYYGSNTAVMRTETRRENLDSILSFIHNYLDNTTCPDDLRQSIDLAVEEVFVNIASYAYESYTATAGSNTMNEAEIRIQSITNPNGISISIKDWGKPFNPLEKKDPDISLSGDERSIGGLGIYLVKKTMDNVNYSRQDDANILTIRKYF